MMRAPISSLWARRMRSQAARSLYGSTMTSRSTPSGWPGYSGIAVGPPGSSRLAGGLTLTATCSWAPWYPPSNLASLCLPVNAHAARMAISVPSVPEFVKRIVSSEGMRSQRSCATRTCTSVGRAEGRALAGLLAERLDHHRVRVAHDEGRRVQHEVEIAVAVDVVDVVAVAVVREEGIGREVRGPAGAAAGQDLLGLGLEGPGLGGLRDVALDLSGDGCRRHGLSSAFGALGAAPARKGFHEPRRTARPGVRP